MKNISFSSNKAAIFLVVVLFCAMASESCIYDQLNHTNSPIQIVNYDPDTDPFNSSNRDKRHLTAEKFESIRIHVTYVSINASLTNEESNRVKQIVQTTINKAQELFSVRRVVGPLLLQRSEACLLSWSSGVNTGKCQSPAEDVNEYCLNKELQIPDDHLEGVFLYNQTYTEPVVVVKLNGTGLPDTDFVLYVKSQYTPYCSNQGFVTVMAYSSYCQQDQYKRPIAAYINFCPLYVRDGRYDPDQLYVTALHELFHTLGFSQQLYDDLRLCSDRTDDITCLPLTKAVRKVNGIYRMTTRNVVNKTSEHFQCRTGLTINEFGPRMDTNGDQVMSHWDAAFMYSSIMAPTIGEADLTILDPMTLAYFEDTSWYKVNYSLAESYWWGVAGGCNFSLSDQCSTMDNDYFCQKEGHQSCHYMMTSKGTCQSDPYLHGCFVYKAALEASCLTANNATVLAPGESYGPNSRCYVSNLTLPQYSSWSNVTLTSGHCYQSRCGESGDLEVKVANSWWISCPYGTSIEVDGYIGLLHCPDQSYICEGSLPSGIPLPGTTTPGDIMPHSGAGSSDTVKPTTSIPTYLEEDQTYSSVLSIIFPALTVSGVTVTLSLQSFQKMCLDKVTVLTRVSSQRCINPVVMEGSVVVQFDLLPARNSNDGPPNWYAIAMLNDNISQGNFKFTVSSQTYIAEELRVSGVGSSTNNPTPLVIGVVVGSVSAILLFIALIYLIKRCTSKSLKRCKSCDVKSVSSERNSLSSNYSQQSVTKMAVQSTNQNSGSASEKLARKKQYQLSVFNGSLPNLLQLPDTQVLPDPTRPLTLPVTNGLYSRMVETRPALKSTPSALKRRTSQTGLSRSSSAGSCVSFGENVIIPIDNEAPVDRSVGEILPRTGCLKSPSGGKVTTTKKPPKYTQNQGLGEAPTAWAVLNADKRNHYNKSSQHGHRTEEDGHNSLTRQSRSFSSADSRKDVKVKIRRTSSFSHHNFSSLSCHDIVLDCDDEVVAGVQRVEPQGVRVERLVPQVLAGGSCVKVKDGQLVEDDQLSIGSWKSFSSSSSQSDMDR